MIWNLKKFDQEKIVRVCPEESPWSTDYWFVLVQMKEEERSNALISFSQNSQVHVTNTQLITI